MEFNVKSGSPEKQRTQCLIVGVYESRRLTEAAAQVDAAADGLLATLTRRGDLEGKAGQTLLLHNVPNVPADRVLLVGLGRERDFGEREYRKAVRHATQALADTGATDAACYLTELALRGRDVYWKVRALVEEVEAGLYRFDQLKSKKDSDRRPTRRMSLSVPTRRDLAPGEQAVRDGLALARACALARDLGNLPPNLCTPGYLAEQAQELAQRHATVSVEVLERDDMEQLGMGALLAVARGSQQPPKLITLAYRGGPENERPYAFIGKGVTFDSGGISIKPAANMDEMKYDMAGAASVLALLQACAELELPLNVVGLMPATENLPSGTATRPGDIVTSMSGQTIEILNTDAEGRLILCDALTYAERHDPAVMVDIATLTGACVVALGKRAHGLFGNHPPLVNQLLEAGRYTGDRAWELPLWEEYEELLKSNFADMANVGGRDAGAITAACFLHKFTRRARWAHLDIAGTAWLSGDKKGGTGRPVPLLLQYLLDRCGDRREAAK